MKNLFKVTFVALIASLMVSCGADQGNFVGKWTPDLTSVEYHIHEDLASEIPGGMDDADIKKSLKEAQPMMALVDIEFKEDGTLSIGMGSEKEDLKWTVDGDNLVITGEVPEGEFKGKDIELAFEIVESTAEKFTIKISALSIKQQFEAQYEKEMKEAMEEAGDKQHLLNDDVLSDTWATISFDKSGAS